MELIDKVALMARIQSGGKHQASQNANRYDPVVLAYGDCYAMAKTAPAVDAVEVVRCKDCIWFTGRHILHGDGTKTFVDKESPFVTVDVGINVQAKCDRHSYVENNFVNDDGNDYCSYGRRESEGV